MLCFGLSCVLGDRDLGDMELGEWSGEAAIGGEGMDSGLLFRKPGLSFLSVPRSAWPDSAAATRLYRGL